TESLARNLIFRASSVFCTRAEGKSPDSTLPTRGIVLHPMDGPWRLGCALDPGAQGAWLRSYSADGLCNRRGGGICFALVLWRDGGPSHVTDARAPMAVLRRSRLAGSREFRHSIRLESVVRAGADPSLQPLLGANDQHLLS